jgi:hypothetical protein
MRRKYKRCESEPASLVGQQEKRSENAVLSRVIAMISFNLLHARPLRLYPSIVEESAV